MGLINYLERAKFLADAFGDTERPTLSEKINKEHTKRRKKEKLNQSINNEQTSKENKHQNKCKKKDR